MVKVKNIQKKGFTLVEILIVVGLLGVALTLTTGILLSVVKTTRRQEILRNIEREGDLIIRQIEENVRKANSVVYDSPNRILIVQVPDSTTGIITRYFGWNIDDAVCPNNYIFMTQDSLLGQDLIANRLTNSSGNNVKVSEFTIIPYTTERPTQLFVKLTLESCYDSSVTRSFQTFVTARGTYY